MNITCDPHCVKRLVLVLGEASLETAPAEILNHPIMLREARRRRLDPRYIILDRARHHGAMLGLSPKRGRPDITHVSILLAQNSTLNKAGLLRTYVHTINDLVISVHPGMRPPRSYNNFIGLMTQLFRHGKVPPGGEALMRIEGRGLEQIVRAENPSRIYLLDDARGVGTNAWDFANTVIKDVVPMVIVGAFPHGEFEEKTYFIADRVIKLGNEAMDTQWVLCRVITMIEWAMGLIT
jgi:rRNA small subunit pseudouridine methyltransferase Nep1